VNANAKVVPSHWQLHSIPMDLYKSLLSQRMSHMHFELSRSTASMRRLGSRSSISATSASSYPAPMFSHKISSCGRAPELDLFLTNFLYQLCSCLLEIVAV
jgi:hypothetical protein